MGPQVQNDADSDDSSEERQLFTLFRHVCVCACESPVPRDSVTGHVWLESFCQHSFYQLDSSSSLHELVYEHTAITWAVS